MLAIEGFTALLVGPNMNAERRRDARVSRPVVRITRQHHQHITPRTVARRSL